MDNVSGNSKDWCKDQEAINKEKTKKTLTTKVKKKKVQLPKVEKLDSFINGVENYYAEVHNKYISDLLVHLNSSKKTLEKYLEEKDLY